MDQRVMIAGTSRQDLNGKRGIATDFHLVQNAAHVIDSLQSRYTVCLDSGEQFKVRCEHVQAENWEVESPLLGQRVEDVTDGQRGRAVVFFKPGKYTVRFDNGELVWVKAADLRAEPAGRADHTRKAKGKGKKGRGKGGK